MFHLNRSGQLFCVGKILRIIILLCAVFFRIIHDIMDAFQGGTHFLQALAGADQLAGRSCKGSHTCLERQ